MDMKGKNKNYDTPLLYSEAVSSESGFAASSGFGGANQAGSSVSENGDYTYTL